MQNVSMGQEIEELAATFLIDHDVPFHTRTSPSTSGATQKLADAQARFVMPSAGSGQRICAVAAHAVPSQASAPPSGVSATQKLADAHETWWAKPRGSEADQALPFQMKALPLVRLEPTAMQKVTEGQETDA